MIIYTLSQRADAILEIYDLPGRRVQTIAIGIQEAGEHRVIWNAGDFPTGIYFYKLTAAGFSQSRMMLLVK